jgi:dihydroceramidase
MQLVDELSMIYTTCVMCYEAFSFQKPPASKSLLAITLTCLALFITVYIEHAPAPWHIHILLDFCRDMH